MKILVINCGSSSIKYRLFDMNTETVLARGLIERIGLEGSRINHQPAGKQKLKWEEPIPDHRVAVQKALRALTDTRYGVIGDMGEIDGVGHRVAHGGDKFSSSVLIDDEVKKAIRELSELAPLHNPPNLVGIEAAEKVLPDVPQVAVFDTAFHQTMPPEAYLYSIPYDLGRRYGIRKYGFHGTSHKYVAQRASKLMGRALEELKLVTCHLGNGASVTAIRGGQSVETSMGFTPLEGLTMGTRCGDIDPAVVTFLMEKKQMTVQEVNEFLNKECGVLGISGISSDFRDLEEAAARGHERAQLALKIFAHDVKKYVGAYVAVLNGIDALVFTAGIGENSPRIREEICKEMEYLGLKIDLDKNKVMGEEKEISAADSRVKIWVIPTNEELMIARDTREVIENRGKM
ncbi:acetate/propionate family kinase [Calderihabitans maritimus]|uniref:Acetate kinase n=1 Tax=Calderihabitans maritimus TaxID=1246530 RepID=A0A1Z5HPE9_9FIRM|nr:acetate kinase [Calderihabitans maritimus]GAW91399.1 acetate kinase [Calderihabitans maritimus]